ncbi:UPF0721 transmembrane protein [Betaproteobacteria bacterium]|nr:UPF0721 transmembrane protein [Betaproteobacteria bacterium]GHU29138.1 UPF0721 transmembrane protein [Betaproteobacteria bacterium]
MPADGFSLLILGLAAFGAGFVDAVVGGGGLIQLPALFAAFPTATPASLFGTNKAAAIVGTLSAAIQYQRRVSIAWSVVLPGTLAALIGAWLGARTVSWMPPTLLRPLILVLLIAVALYTFVRKDMGTKEAGAASTLPAHAPLIAALIGVTLGFYDGFFGPGTGSFLIFLFVRFLNMDFLHASASAKILNVATNAAALAYFATNLTLLWTLAAIMAVCNLGGALLGSRLAIRHGTRFVRAMFLTVVIALIAKLGVDTLFAT